MDWMEEVCKHKKRENQILFSKDSTLLCELSMLIQGQQRRVRGLGAAEQARRLAEG